MPARFILFNNPTTTPIIKATASNKAKMMQLLLDNGACAHLGDRLSNTPLHWAARKGNLAAVSLLCRSDSTANGTDLHLFLLAPWHVLQNIRVASNSLIQQAAHEVMRKLAIVVSFQTGFTTSMVVDVPNGIA
ncbi:hypothetical protein TSMEX_001226, partial [Taenia solium]